MNTKVLCIMSRSSILLWLIANILVTKITHSWLHQRDFHESCCVSGTDDWIKNLLTLCIFSPFMQKKKRESFTVLPSVDKWLKHWYVHPTLFEWVALILVISVSSYEKYYLDIEGNLQKLACEECVLWRDYSMYHGSGNTVLSSWNKQKAKVRNLNWKKTCSFCLRWGPISHWIPKRIWFFFICCGYACNLNHLAIVRTINILKGDTCLACDAYSMKEPCV